VVESDNQLFAAEEAKGGTSAPKARSGKPKAASAPGDDGDVVFFGGKFKGCTISEVYAMTEDDAKERGHAYGAGSTYITNYVATDKNTNDTTREAAKLFLAAL
jgi:hypothetical protein